jgi:C4-dicarboxylate transporter DctM subunit
VSIVVCALVLFGLFAGLLAVGAPVAVALGLSALVAVGLSEPSSMAGLINVLFSVPLKPTLLPIPLFIALGLVLAESTLIRRLIDLANRLVGWLPGGLGVVAIVVGIFFAGISGSGPADVAALGTILIPALVKAGFPRPRAAALLAACGSLGIVVPPSIALILYAFVAQTGVQSWILANPHAPLPTAPSIERLFLAGIVPGLILGAALAALVIVTAKRAKRPSAPSTELREDKARTGIPPARSGTDVAHSTLTLAARALPGLVIPVLILGGIYLGIFTATQSAAVATLYALALEVLFYREMTPRSLELALWRAARTTAQVMLLVGCASMFSTALILLRLDGPALRALEALPRSPVVFLLAVNVLVLALGCVLDAVSILFIVVPIIVPAALSLGIDPVDLGVIITVNLAIGQITPPVGVNLFVAASISGDPLGKIICEVWPLVGVEIAALVLINALALIG